MDIALDAGAEDMLTEDDCYEIYTVPSDLGTVREALEAKGVQIVSADVDMIPDNEVTPTAHADTVRKLIDKLEELDDVQNVFHNAILPEDDEEE